VSQSDFVSRGQALVSAGQFQEAVKVCRLGLLGRPTTVEGRVVLGQALLALRRYDEVLAEMRVALELDHASLPAQLLKAEALMRKGDFHGSLEALQRPRMTDAQHPMVLKLVADAQLGLGRPVVTASHPAVGFVGGAGPSGNSNNNAIDTKHYVQHQADEADTTNDRGAGAGDDDDDDINYTRPAAPQAKKRSEPRAAAPAKLFGTAGPIVGIPGGTPSPEVLAVGDRSGTMEVDPDLDGIELRPSHDDMGETIQPPQRVVAGPEAPTVSARGQRSLEIAAAVAAKRPAPKPKKLDIATVDLDDDDELDAAETHLPPEKKRQVPGPGTHVRNAVQMPAGPLPGAPLPPPAAMRPTQHQAVPPAPAPRPGNPPNLALSRTMPAAAAPPMPMPMPLPPSPMTPPSPHGIAAMPTMAAQSAPYAPTLAPSTPLFPAQPHHPTPPGMGMQQPPGIGLLPTPAVGMPQYGSPHQMPPPGYGPPPSGPGYGMPPPSGPGYGMPPPPMMPPPHMDPALHMFVGTGETGGKRTGVRKARSKLQVALWIVIGALVIGGGVFAGFQIRAMRLRNQIESARQDAVALARADTWKGWVYAREQLARIASVSVTPENTALLARTRALVAYEFLDGVADAKTAVDALPDGDSLDAAIAHAYLALAQNDPRAARQAADRAVKLEASDPGALYVAGRAALLAGDVNAAVTSLDAAVKGEPRPLYAIGLAEAHAARSEWPEALTAIETALKQSPDHPGALIAKVRIHAASGRIQPNSSATVELRGALLKVVSEGARPAAEQTRGVSPADVGFADLALAQLDTLRNDPTTANGDMQSTIALNIDDQRFAEDTVETLYVMGRLENARKLADSALKYWQQNGRLRVAKAQILLAEDNAAEALDVLAKITDIAQQPRALALRGQAKLAAGDLDGARTDLDAALKKVPTLEPALIGRAWLELASNAVADARARLVKRYNPQGTSIPLATVYAEALRRTGDAGAKEAKTVLDRVSGGAATYETGRLLVVLGRVDRDLSELNLARADFARAAEAGITDARLESGLLAIDAQDPEGGKKTIDQLLSDAGGKASARLFLEGARAHMLVGDHDAASQLLASAKRLVDANAVGRLVQWQLDRETGRLALRRGDYELAATSFARALEASGDDVETLLLAADVAAADEKHGKLGDRVAALAKERLRDRPELAIVTGKLALFTKPDDAQKAYDSAIRALEKALPRRRAQAQLGLAILAYFRNEAMADKAFDLAIDLDPTLYAAYQYRADLNLTTDPKAALKYSHDAVLKNPDLVDTWVQVGTLARRQGDRKLYNEAVTRVTALAPDSPALKQLR
jgi:tetratricopeptide (TPR) repeat protein